MGSSAKIISGPSGAAFANMIFAKNAIIINSYFILNKMNCWENLSLDMGFKYIPVRTNAVIRNQKPDHFQDLEIDIKHFENILASISPTTINSN